MFVTFASPFYLLLLLGVLALVYLKYRTKFLEDLSFPISKIQPLQKAQGKQRKIQKIWMEIPFLLFCIALMSWIFALARPQKSQKYISHDREGIEIVLSVDTSLSMWFLDDESGDMVVVREDYINGRLRDIYQDLTHSLKPRISMAKKVLKEFVERRKADKIGLVIFKARTLTLSPPTTQFRYIQNLVEELSLAMIQGFDGTGIGEALGGAINSLRYSEATSKIIILITDGNDNQPNAVFTPLEAAEIAVKENIKIYTIGIGAHARVFAPWLIMSPFLSYDAYEKTPYFIEYSSEQINQDSLEEIAEMTGGKFYRAFNEKELELIYQDIDQLEKNRFEDAWTFKKEEIFSFFLYLSIALLTLSLILEYLIIPVFP